MLRNGSHRDVVFCYFRGSVLEKNRIYEIQDIDVVIGYRSNKPKIANLVLDFYLKFNLKIDICLVQKNRIYEKKYLLYLITNYGIIFHGKPLTSPTKQQVKEYISENMEEYLLEIRNRLEKETSLKIVKRVIRVIGIINFMENGEITRDLEECLNLAFYYKIISEEDTKLVNLQGFKSLPRKDLLKKIIEGAIKIFLLNKN